MMYLVLDSETTGFFDFSKPAHAVHFAKRRPDDPDRVEEVEAPAEATVTG